ncbi:GDP-mannose 4,6-dehydratase [Candidatus Micrarchaeota archaeon]|nr:GDP-mannose 4,6-dehydratase [Candidatus Micrarchaeota archaeon]
MNPTAQYWKGKKVLITGLTGFVGSWLAEKLVELDADVHGLVRRHAAGGFDNLERVKGRVKMTDGDLSDTGSLLSAMKKNDIQVVFHLGAQSFVPYSFAAPIDTYQHNIMGTANLLEAVRIYDRLERMHFAGSSEEYGLVRPEETPITEDNPLRPMSPYALTKVAGDLMCWTHFKAYKIPVVRTRAFNHTGPRRGDTFVTSTVTRQAAEVKHGSRKEFELGNLDAKRDFSDARDIIVGYMLAVEKGEVGDVYNLASGKAYSIRELVDIACRHAGVKPVIRQDPARMRPSDVPLLLGSFKKAHEKFGYEPTIPFEKTIADLFAYQEQKMLAGK